MPPWMKSFIQRLFTQPNSQMLHIKLAFQAESEAVLKAQLCRSYCPQLRQAVTDILRERGYSPTEIAQWIQS